METITLNGWTVEQGINHVMKQCKPAWVKYAGDDARGEYRGFAALHDKCDANMLFPFAEEHNAADASATEYYNLVMAGVSAVIVALNEKAPMSGQGMSDQNAATVKGGAMNLGKGL